MAVCGTEMIRGNQGTGVKFGGGGGGRGRDRLCSSSRPPEATPSTTIRQPGYRIHDRLAKPSLRLALLRNHRKHVSLTLTVPLKKDFCFAGNFTVFRNTDDYKNSIVEISLSLNQV
jgi:hypothetical protein